MKNKNELSQLTLNALEEEVSRKIRIEKRQQLVSISNIVLINLYYDINI